MKTPKDAAIQWIDALNAGDVDALVAASDQNIAIIGPRGVAKGTEILREWYEHTHVTFDLEQLLMCNDQVICVGIAHWHQDDGSELGSAPTAFLMTVSSDSLITELSRHDEGLDAALAASSAPDKSGWQ